MLAGVRRNLNVLCTAFLWSLMSLRFSYVHWPPVFHCLRTTCSFYWSVYWMGCLVFGEFSVCSRHQSSAGMEQAKTSSHYVGHHFFQLFLLLCRGVVVSWNHCFLSPLLVLHLPMDTLCTSLKKYYHYLLRFGDQDFAFLVVNLSVIVCRQIYNLPWSWFIIPHAEWNITFILALLARPPIF